MLPERLYPANLLIEGQRCLVVGGGAVALRKAEGLLACGARAHLIATRVSEQVKALEGLSWEERPYEPGDAAGYRLVLVATDDPSVNRAVAEDAEVHGAWVNSADDPENCTFFLPARVQRGSLLVTVSTGGRSPALASWLREKLEAEIPPEYGLLVDILAEAREALRASGRSTGGLDWHKALDSGMLELIRQGRIADAKERLQACLSSP